METNGDVERSGSTQANSSYGFTRYQPRDSAHSTTETSQSTSYSRTVTPQSNADESTNSYNASVTMQTVQNNNDVYSNGSKGSSMDIGSWLEWSQSVLFKSFIVRILLISWWRMIVEKSSILMGDQVRLSHDSYSWLCLDMYGYALNKFWWQVHIIMKLWLSPS